MKKILQAGLAMLAIASLVASCSAANIENTQGPSSAVSPPVKNVQEFVPLLERLPIEVEGDAVLISTVTAKGSKIVAVILKYDKQLLGSTDLRTAYEVEVRNFPTSDGVISAKRTIVSAHTSIIPSLNDSSSGQYVVLSLLDTDIASGANRIETQEDAPIRVDVGTSTPSGKKDIVQAKKVPVPFLDVSYKINQIGKLTTVDGQTVEPNEWTISLSSENVYDPVLSQFEEDAFTGDIPDAETVGYRLRKGNKDSSPLVVFLHGSGQYGDDNLAHVLSSRGAVGVLDWEDAYVLAPQYASIFDPVSNGGDCPRGMHWQSEHRQDQVINLIEKVIAENPSIDRSRVYIQGLSRGAEGALGILSKRPDLFAGALLMSGRELKSCELVAGRSSAADFQSLKQIPLWFFHAKDDPISPVEGTRKNVAALKEIGSTQVKYTEFDTTSHRDNGWSNDSPHNTWDFVYNSSDVWEWLLAQVKTQ